ncbi:hypothetical protein [Amantichitinum ursilacus]|uniref:Glycine zipper domain-containing protein n=1 Tax=Amantichitinum ursilacus TaxID=857265 RepID=A0A0N1JRP5_9NEIS|nr:hypothetical protein [Amantichitinum ursilacus]KPC49629.1 hypothetical protein WG78_19940 [Amantichitinum ursilacus]
MADSKDLKHEANHDPVTGEGEFHPAGTAGGAAVGGAVGIGAAAAAGAAMGAAAGPIGLAAGAVVGAVAGGLAGKAVAERVDPTVEDEYWRNNHTTQTFTAGRPFDDFHGAYRTGYEGADRYPDKTFDEVEPDLQNDYARNRGASTLDWPDSRDAARASWDRIVAQRVER